MDFSRGKLTWGTLNSKWGKMGDHQNKFLPTSRSLMKPQQVAFFVENLFFHKKTASILKYHQNSQVHYDLKTNEYQILEYKPFLTY